MGWNEFLVLSFEFLVGEQAGTGQRRGFSVAALHDRGKCGSATTIRSVAGRVLAC